MAYSKEPSSRQELNAIPSIYREESARWCLFFKMHTSMTTLFPCKRPTMTWWFLAIKLATLSTDACRRVFIIWMNRLCPDSSSKTKQDKDLFKWNFIKWTLSRVCPAIRPHRLDAKNVICRKKLIVAVVPSNLDSFLWLLCQLCLLFFIHF